MKNFLVQSFLIGGMLSLISSFLFLIGGDVLEYTNAIFTLIFVTYVIISVFLPPIKWTKKFKVNYPKTSIYLISFGWTPFATFIIYVAAFIYGYLSVLMSSDIEKLEAIYSKFLGIAVIIYVLALIISFITATIIVLRKRIN